MSAAVSKLPPARQLRLARRSRDLWKERASDKQRSLKKLRITVRDLTASRDLWKGRAAELSDEVAALRQQVAQVGLPCPGGPPLGEA